MKPDLTLTAARIYACRKAPYLAPMLFRLQFEARTALPHAICVNATGQCYYNQPMLLELGAWSAPVLGGLLVHECWHVLRRHFVRRSLATPSDHHELSGKQSKISTNLPLLWNIAADLAINDGMLCQGFELPKWGQFAGHYGWPVFETAEFYFDKLLQASAQDLQQLEQRLLRAGLTLDEFVQLMSRGGDEAPVGIERKLEAQGVAQRLREHANHNPGSLPGDQERWVGELLQPPKVRWEDELRHGLRALLTRGDLDYSWKRTNRRKSGDLLFPGLAAHRPVVAVVEDTSGSMGSTELQRARDETAGILRTLQSPVVVLCCDAAVASLQKVYNIRQLKLVGGGGTDMALGITQAATLKPRPEVVVCLTDGYTGWPEKAPSGCKFITVLVGDGVGPTFGKVIHTL